MSLPARSAVTGSDPALEFTHSSSGAMDNGLTQVPASEVLTHLALYAGWPSVFSAVPVVKGVFESQAK